MSEERERQRNWADLPPELIHLISKQLPDLRDFIRFRAVCPNWCSSAPLSDPPPQQLPWLLERLQLHPQVREVHGLGKELHFYSLSTGKIGVIHVKESHRGKPINGPSCGYLLLCDKNCIIPFNPLTNLQISLPSTERAYYSHFCHNICPVWTGSDPILSRKIAFMGNFPGGYWGIYYPDKTEWIIHRDYFECSCFSHGLFFGELRSTFLIYVCDATSTEMKPPLYQIRPPEDYQYDQYYKRYLVEISGVVMRVCLYLDWGQKCLYVDWDQNVEKTLFHFYKLNFQGKDEQPYWVEVGDIADHMLFLDEKNAFSLKPTGGLKGNCIYFFNRKGGTPCRYDIMAGTFERIPCPFEVCSWFVPSLV